MSCKFNLVINDIHYVEKGEERRLEKANSGNRR
jgi:hypothetical protein